MLRKKVILYDIQISIYNAFMDKSREIIMNKWNELKSEHYEGPYCIDYKGGMKVWMMFEEAILKIMMNI